MVNAQPQYWCPNDEFSALIAPSSAIGMNFSTIGTIRFAPLSSTNTSNFLTTYLSDLYVAASMRWFAEYQRDSEMAQRWEDVYKGLLGSAEVEEARKKFADMFPRPSKPTSLTDQAAPPSQT
jgi:hypothetical protein